MVTSTRIPHARNLSFSDICDQQVAESNQKWAWKIPDAVWEPSRESFVGKESGEARHCGHRRAPDHRETRGMPALRLADQYARVHRGRYRRAARERDAKISVSWVTGRGQRIIMGVKCPSHYLTWYSG